MITLSGNFYQFIMKLFYYFLSVSQTLFDFLTYEINLSLFGNDVSFYPSMVFAGSIFFTLITMRLIKKFIPMA